MGLYDDHKLLIANRGEIAVRIIRTAKKLGIRTVAIYTHSDSLSPHVTLANESAPLPLQEDGSEASAYLSGSNIIAICKECAVTLVHPGYGFLSENADFAAQVIQSGIGWIGPSPEVIRLMGIKHAARKAALNVGVDVVPGSDGLVGTEEEALDMATKCGYPVMLKATAGGGGMGMVVCFDEQALRNNFSVTTNRAKSLFNDDGVFLEKYYPAARHVEIQVFGNGLGDVVHMRERECSVQRRHQKVIEESPSPFCTTHPGLRERMCDVAVNLAKSIKYESAGTVEFLVDVSTAKFFFLEMNTRIQVEHPVTEETHHGLDIVELMIKQAVAHGTSAKGLSSGSPEMLQTTYDHFQRISEAKGRSHSIEGRIYAENPYEGFVPCPGLLQYVSLGEKVDSNWLRFDSWVATGMSITPCFDPLLAKVIVTGSSRQEAIYRFLDALSYSKISGPQNNIHYLEDIAKDATFQAGLATTTFLATFTSDARAFKVLSPGIETTVQDLPGRTLRLGIPRSGPMDNLAFSVGNVLAGNHMNTEGLEIIVVPGVVFSLQFFVSAVVSVTGKDTIVKLNDVEVPLWSRVVVPVNGKLNVEAKPLGISTTGFRSYLCIRGGFPNIPLYLGSKSTSMGLGGYQGRSLIKGDLITLGHCSPTHNDQSGPLSLPQTLIPSYPPHWVVYVLSGPHDDEEYITPEGIERFYKTHWHISSSSNRLGIRLEAPTSTDKINWARESGGEGGSHPSNILDNGYAPGTININGDTPVILTNEGPDMGGYLCMCTVSTAEMWKLGQLAPGSTVEFRRISWKDSIDRLAQAETWLNWVGEFVKSVTKVMPQQPNFSLWDFSVIDTYHPPILHSQTGASQGSVITVTYRQAGDSAVLVEFGDMQLDVMIRARIHAFQSNLQASNTFGIGNISPCIRSILCTYNPRATSQGDFLTSLIDAERKIPSDMSTMKFPGRRITFPIVLDDKWNREALERYMVSARDKAVYLPSNVDYLARNNGLSDSSEALRKLVQSDWLVLGVGFYLACPFLIPIDPRCRLIGQKMNPSRTFTPRGAIGIAGPVAAIYPIESPGGYQLYGRTLPGWQTWGNGADFHPSKPWLLEAFDQIRFMPVTEEAYIQFERQFDAGQYSFKIEHVIFSIKEYSELLESVSGEVENFRLNQRICSQKEEIRERTLLQEWEDRKAAQMNDVGYSDSLQGAQGGVEITASLFASVWKINCKLGDIIESEATALIILEAMKTEIPVLAGEANVGKRIKEFGKSTREGTSVAPGETLIILE